ncbi:SAV_915 family protein [Nonomuraea sp. NPDC050404]|uniref:SAV_915 family protein n=1 Tax=Nonomuraea sp. NPDC050404 TaxID=3155783 RepID=UPI0033CC205F
MRIARRATSAARSPLGPGRRGPGDGRAGPACEISARLPSGRRRLAREETATTPALFIPVRQCRVGVSLRLFSTVAGERTAVAFTSSMRLRSVLGAGHPWVRLAEPALRGLIDDLDVNTVVVDPAAARGPRPGVRRPDVRPASAPCHSHGERQTDSTKGRFAP